MSKFAHQTRCLICEFHVHTKNNKLKYMKKLITILAVLFAVSSTYAQVPQGISYQAIAFNAAGNPVVSSNVSVRITILDNSATGTEVYKETHTKTTNNKGLFNLNIGQGTPVTGTFAAINWSTNNKFLKVELDPAGGTNYTQTGTNQLMSVPFALVAGSAANVGTSGNSLNNQIIENRSANFAFDDSYGSKVYVFNAQTGTWSSQTYNSNSNPQIKSTNGNFVFVDSYDSKVYVCNGQTGTWSSQTYNSNSNPQIIVDTVLSNIAFNDGYASKVYVYNLKTGTWVSQSYNSNTNPQIIASNGNFVFVDGYDSKVYAFSAKTGTWISQAYNSNSNPQIKYLNGNFIFNDGYASKVYVFNAKTGTWSSQIYNSNSNPQIIISGTN